MEFRLCTEADLLQLAHLRWDFRAESGEEQPAVSKDRFLEACLAFLREGLADGSRAYWIAVENGEIVSHIFVLNVELVPRPCKISDRFGCVTNNYTKPSHRNLGIGSRLMEKVKLWAAEQDMELLIVWPSEGAMKLYERAGFRSENEIMELRLREYYSPSWANTDDDR